MKQPSTSSILKQFFSLVFLSFIFVSDAQTNPFKCPIALKMNFLPEEKEMFKNTDSGVVNVFRYVQHFDCLDMTDDDFTESLFWRIPNQWKAFHLNFAKNDSSDQTIIYGLSLAAFKFLSASGKLEGEIDTSGNWLINGNIELNLQNIIDHKTFTRTIVFKNTFTRYVLVQKKDRHRLFDFIEGN